MRSEQKDIKQQLLVPMRSVGYVTLSILCFLVILCVLIILVRVVLGWQPA